jgi:hypothetical protein
VGSLDRRVEALERLYHSSTDDEEHSVAERSREELSRKAWVGTLDAIAHIRRAPIDKPSAWRYEVESLKDKGAFAIACYVAALTDLGHPDEERAREILEESDHAEQESEGLPLWAMIDDLVAMMGQIREERERGA